MNNNRLKNLVVLILIWGPLNICFAQWSWTPLNSGITTNLNSISFLNSNTGFACGDSGKVIKTTDGGAHWSQINTGSTEALYSISFANVNTGIVLGYGTVSLRTTNGGINWATIPSLIFRYQVQFTDSITAYAVGAGNQVTKTTDAGATWVTKTVSSTASFYSLSFLNSLTGFCGSGSPLVYKTTDGGNTWTSSGAASLNYGLSFGDINTGYAYGDGSVERTTNSGSSWNQILPISTPYGYGSVNFVDANTGFLITGTDSTSVILRTHNMGNSWDTSYIGYESLSKVRFATSDTAYCVGWNGVILKSIHSGKPFHQVSGTVTYKDNGQPVTSGYVKALFYDYSTARVLTVDSTRILTGGIYTLHQVTQDSLDIMFYQNDDELDFVPTYYPSTTDWRQAIKIYAAGNLTGIDGQVYRITNPGSPYIISGMAYQNSSGDVNMPLDNVIVYALVGNVYKNYGISLSNGSYVADKLPPGNYTLLAYRMGFEPLSQSVNITNGNMQNVNFNFGHPIGVPPVCCQLPSQFNLYQNYPNPFNPETNIKFDIPKDDRVKIEIYDITGRVVAKLLDEEVKAGTYNIKWNGSDYASGVYFYRLESESFTMTKKLLMVK